MSDDLTTSISLLSEAATRAENTTTFFDDVTTGGTDETVTNPNNSIEVPTVQKQIYDLYTEDGTTIAAQDAQEAAEAAQEAAEAAQAAAEAAEASTVEISGLDTVYDAIGLVSPANIQWGVEIPFNDSLNIARGYGTYDQIDVSADQDESIMVDLTTKSVDFSRASTTGSINKSSVFETLDEDEPMICSDGLGVFGSYTSYLTDGVSSDFNSSTDADITVTTDLSPDDETYWVEIGFDGNGYISVYTGTDFSDGEYLSASIFVKEDSNPIRISGFFNVSISGSGGSYYQFDPSDPDNPTLKNSDFIYGYKKIDGGYRIYAVFEYLDSNSTSDTALVRIQGDSSIGVATVWGFNATKSSQMLPYVATTVASNSVRSADIATIPMENNFPAAGESFTIITDLLVGGSGTRIICRNGTSLTLYLNSSNQLYFGVYDNDSSSFTGILKASGLSSGDYARIVAKFDGTYCYTYVNGSLIGTSSALVDPNMASSGNLSIGSNAGSAAIDSYMKPLKIVHEALSDSQIAALGSAS